MVNAEPVPRVQEGCLRKHVLYHFKDTKKVKQDRFIQLKYRFRVWISCNWYNLNLTQHYLIIFVSLFLIALLIVFTYERNIC